MTEQSMIERVARAICVGDPDARQPTTKIVWASDMQSAQGTMDYADCRPAWTFEVDKARKAIEEMREPTQAMLDYRDAFVKNEDAKKLWQLQIDEALK